MNKKIFLFSTRFLEKNAGLFLKSNPVENAFAKNDAYCDFFKEEIEKDEDIKQHLFLCYYTDVFHEDFLENEEIDNYLDRQQNCDDAHKVARYDGVACLLPHIVLKLDAEMSVDSSLCPITFNLVKIGEDGQGQSNENKGQSQGNKVGETANSTDNVKQLSENHKQVDIKDLIKYFKKEDINGGILSEPLDIDCESADYKTDWRFRLYKLTLSVDESHDERDCYSAYAVWPLNKNIKHDEYKWYEALYKEIEFQEKIETQEEEEQKIVEIFFFLHDRDVKHTTFNVRHYKKEWTEPDAKFHFLQKNVKLSVALFQHTNDEIARILGANPKDDDERLKLLKKAAEVMEQYGKRAFLNRLSDCVARWHNGGKDEYIRDIEDRNKYGFTSLIEKVDDNSAEKVYNEIKKLINEI